MSTTETTYSIAKLEGEIEGLKVLQEKYRKEKDSYNQFFEHFKWQQALDKQRAIEAKIKEKEAQLMALKSALANDYSEYEAKKAEEAAQAAKEAAKLKEIEGGVNTTQTAGLSGSSILMIGGIIVLLYFLFQPKKGKK